MKTIANFFKSTPVFLMGVILFTSCMKDGSIEPVPKEGQAEFSFNFTTPEPMKVQTRASVAEENHVEMLHLLIFNSGKLVKTVTKTNAELSSSTTTTAKDTWGLKTTLTVGKQYDFVTVANIALPATTVVGVSKADFVMAINAQAYIDTNLTNTTKWMVSNTKPIPMWGEVSTAGNVVSTDQFTIPLKRLMARVNVSVSAAAQVDFELTQVRFYNYNTKGQIIPNHNGTEYKYPSIPAISGKQTTASPAFFGYNNTDGVTATACQNLIYVFENANIGKYSDGTLKKWQDNPTVVIGGKFGGGAETFYRLDFIKVESGNETWLDVKRNHSYNFNITKVNGNGYTAPEDALMSAPINMVATVIPWDDGAVAEVTEDGQYRMGVSKKTYSFSKEPSLNNALSIYTTYTQTDLVVKYSDSETNADAGSAWLTEVSLGNDVGSDMRIYDLKFAAAQNDGTGTRIGYIHILSGRMQMVVKVEQSDKLDVAIWITDMDGITPVESFNFFAEEGVQPDAQKYKIHWSPATSNVTINVAAMGYDPILWESSALSPNEVTVMDDGSGMAELEVQPKAITTADMGSDAFYERQTMVSYHMVYVGQSIIKMLPMRHYVKNIRLVDEPFYLMDAEKKSVTVKSNVPWKLVVRRNTSSSGKRVVSDINGIAIDHIASDGNIEVARGGDNLPEGDVVSFTTVDDLINVAPSIFTGDFELEVVADNADANPDDKVLLCGSGIIQPLSNSYLVAPNSVPILIPVKRANGYGIDKDGAEFRQPGWPHGMTGLFANDNQIDGAYSAELVWTDVPHSTAPVISVGDNGAVKMIQAAGSGENGYVLVMLGAKPGNAVVSASVGGNIVWSWHIWVVDNYNPDPATDIWMDRNLGATTNTPATVSTMGLYYQWGRKDPIPGAGSVSENVDRTYYLGNGTPETAVPWMTTGATLKTSILKPLNSYNAWIGSNGDASWITNNVPSAGTGDKTIYDPCPDGWQVPVRNAHKTNLVSPYHWGNETGETIPSKWNNASGIDWPTKGGYIPASGYRYRGELLSVKNECYLWSSSNNDHNSSWCGRFGNGYTIPSTAPYSDGALNVRCVTEQP